MAVSKKIRIKTDMLDQLERNNVHGEQYLDLIDDYMCLWDIKNKLIKDIRKRGVNIPYNNGGGQEGVKRNDSIQELTKTNTQMLKILNDLGLKADGVEGSGEDNEEM